MDRQARRLGGRKDKEDRWGWELLVGGGAGGSVGGVLVFLVGPSLIFSLDLCQQ